MGPVGSHQDHRLGIAPAQVEQAGLHRGGVTGIQPPRRPRDIPRFSQRVQRAVVTGAAKGIILVHHRDARDAQVCGQAFHHFLGFLVVGSAKIDHVGQRCSVPQERGAGEGAHVRHVGSGGYRKPPPERSACPTAPMRGKKPIPLQSTAWCWRWPTPVHRCRRWSSTPGDDREPPPALLTSAKAARMPTCIPMPSSLAGPLKAADWPKQDTVLEDPRPQPP